MSTIPNLLIVDKDMHQMELMMDLIQDVIRAHVDTTNSGERALELISRTNYQLVIADCGAGDMDGLAILERVKHVSPTTSVILTSSFATIDEAVKAMKLGADEYFKKPVNLEHFKLAVRRSLDRRSLFTGDQAVTGLMYLLNTCQLVSGCLEEEKIFETVVGYIGREANPKGIGLFRVNKTQSGEYEKEHVPTPLDVDADVLEVMVQGNHGIEACIEEKLPMKIISPSEGEMAVFQFHGVDGKIYCVVCLSPQWKTTIEELDSRYRLLQAQIEMTSRSIKNYHSVRYLLYLDEPTGLGNTRHLHHALDRAFEEREKGGVQNFSVLFLDMDHFKSINDTHGHLVGTRLLYQMGQILKKNIKEKDLAFRYGGDEFLVLLFDTNSSQALSVGERIRADVEKRTFLAKEKLNIKLTVSIGVANCPEHATTKKSIIDAADNAMYNVKRAERNKVYLAERKAA